MKNSRQAELDFGLTCSTYFAGVDDFEDCRRGNTVQASSDGFTRPTAALLGGAATTSAMMGAGNGSSPDSSSSLTVNKWGDALPCRKQDYTSLNRDVVMYDAEGSARLDR